MAVSGMNRPNLTLIEGEGRRSSAWLSPPSVALARSPFDKNQIMSLRVARRDLAKQAMAGRRQPILDLWDSIFWEKYRLSQGAERYEALLDGSANGVDKSHAAFRGLRRPISSDDNGFDYAVYIMKPRIGFRFVPSMSCVIEPYDIPSGYVFLCCVKLDFPEGRNYHNRGSVHVTEGTITHGALFEADPASTELPIDYEDRFLSRLW